MIENLLKMRWEPGGRGPVGIDCVGMVLAYAALRGIDLPPIGTTDKRSQTATWLRSLCKPIAGPLKDHPDCVLFFERNGVPSHVGVVLPNGKFLHCIYGGPRCDNDLRLAERVGLNLIGGIPLSETTTLIEALKSEGLGDPITWVVIIVAVVSMALSVALMPGAPRFGAQNGRYGYDALITQNRGDLTIPTLLGTVTLAGNSPFTEPSDKLAAVTAASGQKATRIVVFGQGPYQSVGTETYEFRINGLSYDASYWWSGGGNTGIYLDPVQVKSEAIDGSIDGGSNRPSVTIYPGTYALDVPVDVRAQYVRDMPIWGFNGCAYAVFRMVDSAKYANFNLLARCKGGKTRSFDADGWVIDTETSEPAADGTRRYKMSRSDIKEITFLAYGINTWSEMGPTNQTGRVYVLNRTKGILTFPDIAPTGGGTWTVIFTFFNRYDWSNPANHILSLLAEPGRGLGLDESRIDFTSFEAARAYYAEDVTTPTSAGLVTGPRFTTNYLLDQKRPVVEHLRELLNACRSIILRTNGKIKLKPLKPTDTSVFSFDGSNILEGSFTSELLDQSARSNEIKLQYHSALAFNGEDTVMVGDRADQDSRALRGGEGVRSEALKYSAVDTEAQAVRLAWAGLSSEIDTNWAVQFTASLKGIALEPGDVIDVTHPSQPRWAGKLFRIDDITMDDMDRIVIKASEFLSA